MVSDREKLLSKTIQTYTLAAIFLWLGIWFLLFDRAGIFALGFAAILFVENYLRNHYFLPFDKFWLYAAGGFACLGVLDFLGIHAVGFGFVAIAAKMIFAPR